MPLVLVSVAFFLVAFGLVSGTLRLGAALAMLLVAIAVLVENPVLGWRGLVTGLLLIILFIPIRRYVLPGGMPFQLEPYRLYVMLLVGGWVLSLFADPRVRLRRTGFETPLLLLLAATLCSELANPTLVSSLSTPVLKSLTFFLSFIFVVFVLVSVIHSLDDLEPLVRTLVLGGAVISILALIESRTGFNVFSHLGQFLPFLRPTGSVALDRSGHLRALGPAQHPIALGAALAMLVPLAAYVAATSRSRFWITVAAILPLGVLATLSRTSVVMLLVVLAILVWLHPRAARRLWPMIIPAVVAAHFLIPGTLGTFRAYFLPGGGIVQQQTASKVTVDPSDPASCDIAPRLARVVPMLHLAEQRPLLGQGYGTRITEGPGENACLLDDQWLGNLLETGLVGLAAWWLLILSFVSRALRVARRNDSPRAWLLGALGSSVMAFAVGMFFFDAFSFIQVTFLFFIFLGFGAIALRERGEAVRAKPHRATPGVMALETTPTLQGRP